MGFAGGDGDWSQPSATRKPTAVWRSRVQSPFSIWRALWRKINALAPDRLSMRLVIATLLISSVLSAFTTALQVCSSYQRQRHDALLLFHQIEQVMQRQLELALSRFDFDQVELILDGLMAHNEISHLELGSPTGEQWVRGASGTAFLTEKFKLSSPPSGGSEKYLGDLTVHMTLENIHVRVWAQFWTMLISNMTKAYLSAMLLLFVVHRLVIRHLSRVAAHVSTAQPIDATTRLKLDRKTPRVPDALEQIVGAIQGYEARVEEHVQELNQEMSQRALAQEAAAHAVQTRTQFLSNMGRDIRTPMSSITGLFQLLKDDEDLPHPHRQRAEIGHRAAHQFHTQLTNMLDLSRLDSEDIVPLPIITDMYVLTDSWLFHAQTLVKQSQKQLEVSLNRHPDLAPEYLVDGGLVTRIVGCLIENAVKFSDTGQVELYVRPGSLDGNLTSSSDAQAGTGGIEVVVRDCAPKVRFEDRDQIFLRFTRVENHLSSKTEGAGLGLALARELAELLAGTLLISSGSEGGDLRNEFCLRLPDVSPLQ